VAIERVAGAGNPKGDVIARFIRTRAGAVDDDALRIVGATVELPSMNNCGNLQAASSPSRIARSVELLNAGAITLEADGYRANLTVRHMPDGVGLVSGIVYTVRAEGGAEGLPAFGRVVLRAAGSSEQEVEIGPFTVETNVPAEPNDLRLNG